MTTGAVASSTSLGASAAHTSAATNDAAIANKAMNCLRIVTPSALTAEGRDWISPERGVCCARGAGSIEYSHRRSPHADQTAELLQLAMTIARPHGRRRTNTRTLRFIDIAG